MPELIGHGKLFGSEPIVLHDAALPTTVLAFWSWALSDVISNTARGLLAEFFVACDLGVIDESGEDYLYPASSFVVIEVPQEVERAILHAS